MYMRRRGGLVSESGGIRAVLAFFHGWDGGRRGFFGYLCIDKKGEKTI
jgi:hypothetical protein